jgi:hypothetical protein
MHAASLIPQYYWYVGGVERWQVLLLACKFYLQIMQLPSFASRQCERDGPSFLPPRRLLILLDASLNFCHDNSLPFLYAIE